MLLQKAFFRKKSVKIYIAIFSVLFSVILLLNSYKNYFKIISSEFMNKHTILVIYTNKDNASLVENDKRIDFYQRIISFDEGDNNTIILNPPIIKDEGVEKGEHSSKLYWDELKYNDKILVFPASYMNESLNDEETILVTSDYDLKKEYIDNYIGENINFNYKDNEVILKVKDVMEATTFSYIIISDNLYEKLLDEEDYIYYTELKEYSYLEDIQRDWKELINDNKINVVSSSYFEDEEIGMSENYRNIINILKVADVISIIVFYIVIIVTVKNLVVDEHRDMILLKHMGYNNRQSLLNSLKNIGLLDLIAICLALVIYVLVVITFNLIFSLKLDTFNCCFMLVALSLILVIELLFSIWDIKRTD